MDALVNLQLAMAKRIAEHYEKFMKSPIEDRTITFAKSRLARLDDLWVDFIRQDQDIKALPDYKTNHTYVSGDCYYNTQDAFDKVRSKFLDFIKANSPTKTHANPPSTPPAQQETFLSSPGSLLRGLPPLSMPIFSGVAADWPNFRDMFISLVHQSTVADVVKLTYLRSYLKDEALAVIKAIPIIGTNYAEAWTSLQLYFDNERRLVHGHIADIFQVKPMATESSFEIKRVLNEVLTPLDALKILERPTKEWSDIIVFLLVTKMDSNTRRDWEKTCGNSTKYPTFERLKSFLESQSLMLDAVERSCRSDKPHQSTTSNNKKTASSNPSSIITTTVHSSDSKSKSAKSKHSVRCVLCSKDHYLSKCESYLNKSIEDRKAVVFAKRLCFNCLGTHQMKECKSEKRCFINKCGGRHHSSLHINRPNPVSTNQLDNRSKTLVQSNSTLSIDNPEFIPINQPSSHSTSFEGFTGVTSIPASPGIFLSSAIIFVRNEQGEKIKVRALIDQCSQSSFVSKSLAKRLKLTIKEACNSIGGVGGQKIIKCTKKANFVITPHFSSDFRFEVEALVIDTVSGYQPPKQTYVNSNLNYLCNLNLADPEFYLDVPVHVLLGADVHAELILGEVRKGGPNEPIATASRLGWYISGRAPVETTRTTSNVTITSHHCVCENSLSQQIENFWRQEEVPKVKLLTPEEEDCEDHYKVNTHINDTGRYVVKLPFKKDLAPESLIDLGDSYNKAVSVLYRLERKFVSNPEFAKLYKEFVQDYIDQGHMSLITPNSPNYQPVSKTFFLPHHGVLKPSSSTTKLRTVFNGSSKTSKGISINDLLYTGPNLLPELPNLINNWRLHKYVFTADIQQMFRQILVNEEDRHFQAIVWRFHPDEPIGIYYLNTITYGLVCSPWQATRTLRQLADDYHEVFPKGAEILNRETYMDDMLSGGNSLPETLEKQRQLIELLKVGGMNLRKWIANHPSLVENLPEEHLAAEPEILLQNSATFSVLGLHWEAKNDQFQFQVKVQDDPLVHTKRKVLSSIAQIFDPLGWISPVVITAKIFMQALWLLKCDWDDELPKSFTQEWKSWYSSLPALRKLKISRFIHWSPEVSIVEIHGFADASEHAYAAVLYLRLICANKTFTSLQMSKTRVAPLKTQSIPRLELCAAELLAQIVDRFLENTNLEISAVHLWSDSKDTLFWLRSHPARWKTYIANRCREIQTLVPKAYWHYIESKENPADVASRGIRPDLLTEFDLWWNGPAWLSQSQTSWSTALDDLLNHRLSEEKTVKSSMINVLLCDKLEESPFWILVQKFSSLGKLLRVTSYVFRFIHAIVRRALIKSGNKILDLKLDFLVPLSKPHSIIVSPPELQNSVHYWVYFHQLKYFREERCLLDKHPEILLKGPLRHLNPFIKNDLLRVGGRLERAMLDYAQIHPLILPGNCHFTDLLIRQTHDDALHGGVQLTLGTLRRKFWLVKGRYAVKRIIHSCVPCIRYSKIKYEQLMGQVHNFRTSEAPPFMRSGVDYAGPYPIRPTQFRGKGTTKGYICLFICMVTRAIHLELVEEYTSDAFIGAFHRFTARRGHCAELLSDNGPNFVGADAQLRQMFDEASAFYQETATTLASEGTSWNWNPPSAPHFGGLWEAGVKATKHHLRRVINKSILTFSEMTTLLCRIEACLNSRPLLPLSDEPSDLDFLTPAHLLIQRSSYLVPEADYLNEKIPAGQRWRLITQKTQEFWSRWKDEYLPTLLPRQKWLRRNRSFQLGDIVFITNELTPPGHWPLGRIVESFPDRHGDSRFFTVKTVKSVYERPAVKLILVVPATGTLETRPTLTD